MAKRPTGLLGVTTLVVGSLVTALLWTALTGALWHWAPIVISDAIIVVAVRHLTDPREGFGP